MLHHLPAVFASMGIGKKAEQKSQGSFGFLTANHGVTVAVVPSVTTATVTDTSVEIFQTKN